MSLKMSQIQNANFTLPEGWRWMGLGEVCDEIYRYPTYYNIQYVSEGVPEVRGELIKRNGNLESDLTKYRFISKETSQRYPRTVLREGDFVLSVRGSMGKIATVPKELEGANITANLIRISPNRAMVHSSFFKYVFLSEYFQRTLNTLSPQTTIKTIKAPILKSIEMPIPPFPQQQRIAAKIQELMQEVERARNACEKQLEAAKALPAAYLREVFESEEAKKWERKRLGEVCDVITGSTPRTDDPTNWNGDILWATPNDMGKLIGFIIDDTERKISERGLKSCSTKLLPSGSVLLTTRAPIGHLAINTKPICTNQGFKSFIPSSQIYDWFLFFALKYFVPVLQSMGRGQTFTEISKRQVESFEIPLPSLPAQHRIASELKEKMAEVEKLRTGIEKQLEVINTLPQSILRKAFKGEL